jgi:hypothetical protein
MLSHLAPKLNQVLKLHILERHFANLFNDANLSSAKAKSGFKVIYLERHFANLFNNANSSSAEAKGACILYQLHKHCLYLWFILRLHRIWGPQSHVSNGYRRLFSQE